MLGIPKKANAAHIMAAALPAAAKFIGASGAKNMAEYLALMNLDKVRNFFGAQGSALVRAGFRHGLEGKKVARYGVTGLGAGALAGAAPMSFYEQGHSLGKEIARVSKASGINAYSLLKGIQKSDKGIQGAIATAPYSGAAIGAGRGLLQERNNKPEDRHYGNAAISGAVKGGLLGAGVKRFAPHAGGIRHLHDLRTGQIDSLLGEGKMRKVEGVFDRAATPEVAEKVKRNFAAEGLKQSLHGQPTKGPGLFTGRKNRKSFREGQAEGSKLHKQVDNIPFVTPELAEKAIPRVDDLLRQTLKRAPLIGAGAGAIADVNSERHKKPEKRHYARAAGVGALKGGALGAAVGHFAPHTKGVKGLHEYREKYFNS